MRELPVSSVQRLIHRPAEHRWLIEGLWAEEAVGIVGGEPKCCKSILALQIAVAVASGVDCLGRFVVRRPGRVLLFAAEDALAVVRQRVEAIASFADVSFDSLDIQVITASTVRLDLEADCRRLEATVSQLRPTLLLLDPFVRLHRIDENQSGEVAPLLAFLRGLQRQHRLSVIVVHHAKKGAAHTRAGQALRGSSEFHAWGDSNLYLRRRGEQITLAVEQRAHQAIGDLSLELGSHGDGFGLEIVEDDGDANADDSDSSESRIESVLAAATGPVTHGDLRRASRMRAATFGLVLKGLVERGRVVKTTGGYALSR